MDWIPIWCFSFSRLQLFNCKQNCRDGLLITFLLLKFSSFNSPNVVFLSQSILAEDCGMNVRVAHEITHAWFGLLIGAKDWTEEWLSEGFATYLEERVQSRAEKVFIKWNSPCCSFINLFINSLFLQQKCKSSKNLLRKAFNKSHNAPYYKHVSALPLRLWVHLITDHN